MVSPPGTSETKDELEECDFCAELIEAFRVKKWRVLRIFALLPTICADRSISELIAVALDLESWVAAWRTSCF